MKKNFAVLTLALLLIFPIASCNKSEPSTSEPESKSSSVAESSEASLGEESSSEAEVSSSAAPAASASVTSQKQNELKVSAGVKKSLVGATKEDDESLLSNPDRGFRGIWNNFDLFRYSENTDYNSMVSGIQSGIKSNIPKNNNPKITVMAVYVYLSGYNQGDISNFGLQGVDAMFQALKNLGLKGVIRFCYSDAMPDPQDDAPQSVILRHIDQLAPIVRKWKNVQQSLDAGFIGSWGEWHHEYYTLNRTSMCVRQDTKISYPNPTHLISESA